MSCRPRGPSDRPLHDFYDYYDLEHAGGQAPRLPEQSFASRLLVAGIAVCCCGVATLSLLFALSLVCNFPHALSAMATETGSSFSSLGVRAFGGAAPPPPPRVAQRSVLARFSTLTRATRPATGANPDGVKLAFPHWFDSAGELVTATSLGDITLALAYLAQEDARNIV
jgi:hypothetical protein